MAPWRVSRGALEKVVGPLASTWKFVQDIYEKLSPLDEEDVQQPSEELEEAGELLGLINAAVVTFGQAANRVGYERCLNVLTALADEKRAKRLLKRTRQ